MRNWILPENIADVLPREARQTETLRRSLLDLFGRYGYELVMPPLVEYVESLFVLDDPALNLKTFKLVDELSGRQMGVRADITPQVARIDAHILNRQGVARLCYAGSVVHSRPDGILSSREPRQIGAEIYGYAGIAADVEVIELLVESLSVAGLAQVSLDIGHIGLFHALADAVGLKGDARDAVFDALQQKDLPTLRETTAGLDAGIVAGLLALPTLYGSQGVLERARAVLPEIAGVSSALDTLQALVDALDARGIAYRFDLAEVRSSDYHTGLVFAAYTPGFANAIARGGRYDSVGEKFGRSRPATGFSLDLRALTHLPFPAAAAAILAPASDDAALIAAIRQLRAAGETVLVDLDVRLDESPCDRALRQINGQWQVVSLA
ncbi:ATP phosphoribosyltransferase regulatory subunit [Andreprevotia lacus DSM 23236]|jgi:ATP phosphoribosyltransferase regulatory subunit|uniref:ATP phosphoribosyltransferase regulatory subunit n=1 Tax=Andreprevotia lacus DSM 23236 TaxID=1121001 RepID=A0A1W1XN20_9NEIS|nr:ATP phosphoribosyltransferase regulatory subunit [Andreprevotia lacus]SMC24911.1 ATP phosphoribosyltransferase regulatory subunit [Andreprevotia lacus DSM 23236]